MCCAETWVISFSSCSWWRIWTVCGETSWNHSQNSSWECGNNIKKKCIGVQQATAFRGFRAACQLESLDKAGQLGISPYCSKWLGFWHRPFTVVTVHILYHSHPLHSKRVDRHWLIKESPNLRHFLCLELVSSIKWLYVFLKYLLYLLAFVFSLLVQNNFEVCTCEYLLKESLLFLSLYKRGCILWIMLIQTVGRQPDTA